MSGPPPKPDRVRRSSPALGEWQTATTAGWRHGAIPKPPDGLLPASIAAWSTWFAAWFAAHWSPSDLPVLRQAVRIFNEVEKGDFTRAAECRLWLDSVGITMRGQQLRRWRPPGAVVETNTTTSGGRYGSLRSVPELHPQSKEITND